MATRVMADDGSGTDSRARPVGLHTISFSPLGDTIVCRPDESVLSAILRSGAKVAFGCRGGGCGVCKMRLLSGRVDHGRCSAAVLSEAERTVGSFLSCQARPLTDLTVDLTEANKFRRPPAAYWPTFVRGG